MSIIQVLGRNTSSNVQAVMWTLAELDVEHMREDIGGAFGGNTSAEYLEMNPMGLVPVLKDGDLILFESAAIVRYLAAQYGDPNFWPANPAKRASLDIWSEWAKNTFTKELMYTVFWSLIRTKKQDRDMAAFAAGVESLKKLAQVADDQIAGKEFLGDDHISFADIMFGHALYRYYTLEFDRAVTPALDAYYERLTQRPAFLKNVMVSYESLRVE